VNAVGRLFDGPIDVIGDVHGERAALEHLLVKLGYDDHGNHAEGRKVVFVGDLVDRGPDSPGVLRAVMRMVHAGNAQCVVGNHELNALRDEAHRNRPGEGWWYGRHEAAYASIVVSEEEKARDFAPFLRELPAALERDDLRIVHACWHESSIAKLRESDSLFACFREEQEALLPELSALRGKSDSAIARVGADSDRRWVYGEEFPYVPELAELETKSQMGNAAKVVTSGIERAAGQSFYASQKWRVVERVPWWDGYSGVPVIVGHYWRRYHTDRPHGPDAADLDLFGETPADAWLGRAADVMCIDYSAGYRFRERLEGRTVGSFDHCLAALRVPEWRLVFDDGRPELDVCPPG
jgi:hypothetical protein